MARKLRVEYDGAIYHLTVRSNGGRKLSRDDVDRRYFLVRIGESSDVHQVRVYLFCLMSTHVHMVVETPRGNLGRFMQSLLTGYGVYYNRRYRSHGHVTQGRYGGLTQRDAARPLGLRTGVAVSIQLKRLDQLLNTDETLARIVQQIEQRLDKEQNVYG